MSNDDENFDSVDALGSDVIPTPCSDIKIGKYCMLKGQPCKVTFLK